MGFPNKFLPSAHEYINKVKVTDSAIGQDFINKGEFHYAIEKACNGSDASYQEASGAPVEVKSPLGYSVGPVTLLFLNISMMIGTGIYSTRKHHWRKCLHQF